MLHAGDRFAHVEDLDGFLDLMIFGITRRLATTWYACRGNADVPALAALEPEWWRMGRDYAYRWTVTSDGADLVCTGALSPASGSASTRPGPPARGC